MRLLPDSMNSMVWTCVKLLLVGAVLTFGGVLYYHVSTKDTIEFRTGAINLYLKFKLSKFFAGADVNIQDVQLSWRRADENFFLSAKGLVIIDKKSGLKTEIPEVAIYSKVGILFLWGDWGASRVEIPTVYLSAFSPDGEVSGAKPPFSVSALREKLFMLIRSSVPVRIGSMLLSNQSGESLKVDSLSFGTEAKYDGRIFSLELTSGASSVKVKVSEHYKGVISLNIRCDNFNTALFEYIRFLDGVLPLYNKVLISGAADVVLDAHDRIEYCDIDLQSLKGTVPYGEHDSVAVHGFRVRAKYSDHELLLSDFNLLMDDVALKMRAYFNAINSRLNASVSSYELKTQQVCRYWPEQLYPDLKHWYCDNVIEGTFREPQVTFHGHVNDIKNVANYRFSAHVRDATITVSNKWGAVNIVDGGLLLDRGELVIRSGNYNFRGVNAVEGVAIIKDVSDKDAKLEIRGRAFGDVSEIYTAADGQERFGVVAENISGVANTKFIIEVSNLSGTSDIHSDVYITSEVGDLSVRGVLNSFDVHSAGLDLVVHNGSVEATIKGKMNERDMTLVASGDPGGGSMMCKFEGYISGNNIRQFSAAARHVGLSGYAKATIDWVSNHSGAGDTKVNGVLDVIDLYSELGYFPVGAQARILKFAASVEQDGNIQVHNATLAGQGIDIRLSGHIGQDVNLVANRVRFLKTDAQAHVKSSKDGNLVLQLSGKFLDLSKTNLWAFLSGESRQQGGLEVKLRVHNALMKNNVPIKRVFFSMGYDGDDKLHAKMSANFANDNAPVRIEYGPRGLEVSTENAGNFLRSIDVLSTVDGGHLSIYMYPDSHLGRTQGVFSLTNFNIVNAPILAQILTLSSLQGISNTLNGSGIHFGKLNVPFNYSENRVSFDESWIEGVELGISVGGEINLSTKSFDVRGQIVPAYAVSKLVWNTPLIGKLLTGGYSRGVVAIDYKVKGTDKAHDISVNFLSILAPNLLKRVLKAIDDKSKGGAGNVKQQRAAE
ncbi:acetamidase [Anaplasma marginale str. Dawn]|uniref:YhdP central domain-containing protein n=4 Tax=Anaplasma marginale TaxID=770 RepID=B9KHL9_ANAMF|nr:AsmA-like C-terminal domain-containing protein [Anaplasma marginale]ACM48981.1 Conserved hypothetical protein [Anaplasma marginale str. Florida]AGZ79410.1 acetamidase [Anaplasma marginale str. Dawn]AAV86272.1 hypothetical protein AM127 [Anaplasma marginale str. St. Maries]AGU42449.1 hypothetical protein AM127s [Anaplasma marginale]AGU42450.1 hypothetical protein AM127m [Anaplasma marginale]